MHACKLNTVCIRSGGLSQCMLFAVFYSIWIQW